MIHPHSQVGRVVRSAFTLVEVLVVIILISVVAGISVAVFMKTSGSSQVKTSASMLQKIQIALDKQWTAVRDEAFRDASMNAAWPAGLTKGNADLNRENWVMLKLQQAFPRTFAEVFRPLSVSRASATLTACQLAGLPAYQQTLANYGVQANNPSIPLPGTALTPNANLLLPGGVEARQKTVAIETRSIHALESSACLLMALQRSVGGTGFTPEQLGKASIKDFEVVMNGYHAKFPALVDAWGQPMWFVYEGMTEGNETELRPALLSSGPNFAFDSTVTADTPLEWATSTGILSRTRNAVKVITAESAAKTSTPAHYDLNSR